MKAKALFVAPKQMSSALGSLMSSYGSMSESESGDEPEGKVTFTMTTTHQLYLARLPVYYTLNVELFRS